MAEAEIHDDVSRRITHAELVYRPGERALAARVLGLLGCEVVDRGGYWFTARVDPAEAGFTDNVLYASEITEEQWAFEKALGALVDSDESLGRVSETWLAGVRARPQYSCHFGMRLPSRAALEQAAAAVEAAGKDDPELAGRISVSGIYRPEDSQAATDTMMQVFVHTDVLACGLVTLGQHIELQWHVPQ